MCLHARALGAVMPALRWATGERGEAPSPLGGAQLEVNLTDLIQSRPAFCH